MYAAAAPRAKSSERVLCLSFLASSMGTAAQECKDSTACRWSPSQSFPCLASISLSGTQTAHHCQTGKITHGDQGQSALEN